MAARTGAGVGVITTITIFGILSLALFITTVVFYGNANRAQGELDNLQSEYNDFVSNEERQDAQVQAFLQSAGKERETLTGHLMSNLSNTMRDVSGSPRDGHEAMQGRLNSAQLPGVARAKNWQPGSGQPPSVGQLVQGSNLMSLLRDLDQYIRNLHTELDSANGARERASQDLANEVSRIGTIERTHRQTVDRLTSQIGQLESQVEQYRRQTNDGSANMEARVERLRDEANARQQTMAGRINDLEAENARLANQVEVLRSARSDETLQAQDEAALVDAQVLAVDAASGEATISIGSEQKAVLGMSFAVYPSAGAIQLGPNGEYPYGKATLEIISVDETTSVCRITRETRGSPIVRGDVVANAVYDPNKVYTLLMIGNFDLNRDGLATAQEREEWKAIIEGWGGRVVDEPTGDMDFLVLGRRPVPRAEPSPNAPIEIVQQYLDELVLVERYDQLWDTARATQLPVLNENRLRTLVGAR